MIATTITQRQNVAELVRQRLERGGERLWRFEDFNDLPFTAVAQALSRLTRSGRIVRPSKGTYYLPRQNRFGRSRPYPATIRRLVERLNTMSSFGIAAANLLGLTRQNPKRGELATSGLSAPHNLFGSGAIIHVHRPKAWSKLSPIDAALLEFLRSSGRASDLSPAATIRRVQALLSEDNRMERLCKAAATEPPRVRAILGALGELLGCYNHWIIGLKSSLHPVSLLEFGIFAELPNAQSWQAKEPPPRETP